MHCVLISVLEKPNFNRGPFIQKGFFFLIFQKAEALYQKARNKDFLVMFHCWYLTRNFTAENEGFSTKQNVILLI